MVGKKLDTQSNTSLKIPVKDRQRLEEIARNLGYVQTRGAGTGSLGSISALICAIARGELNVTPSENQVRNNDAS